MKFLYMIPWFLLFIAVCSNIIKTKIIYNRDQTVTHFSERFDHCVRMREIAIKRADKFEKLFYDLKEN